MKNSIFIASLVIGVGITLTGCDHSFAAGGDAQQAQSPVVKHAATPQSSVPAWFMRDVQLTARANPTVGTNYILNYGETNVTVNPQMDQVWYGALSNHGKNNAFGYSWMGVNQQVKSAVQTSPLSINVLEQTKQGGMTVGLLVPAKCIGIGNGDYVAFTNGQAVIATNKSGTVYYSVYPVKGVTIPSAYHWNVSAATSGYGKHDSGISEKTYPSITAATNAIMLLQDYSSGQFVPSGSDSNLGMGIKAKHSTSGGLNMYGWQEGRWSIITQFWANTPDALSVTKNMAIYLHINSLPVLHNKGFIVAGQSITSKGADDLATTIAWQVGTRVYELKETGNPVTVLKTVFTK